jgi:glutaminase
MKSQDLSKKEEKIIFQNLFNSIDEENKGYITKNQLLDILKKQGIKIKDHRISVFIEHINNYSNTDQITLNEFVKISHGNISIIERIIKGNLIIPNFYALSHEIKIIFDKIKKNINGNVASYIPQLARVNPDQLAISVCTIDGQQFSIGQDKVPYCVQSTCKPVNYCIAMELNGEDLVHSHVGREPSGRVFNEITLNKSNLPHNPMINAGAIMCSSLIKPQDTLADRFDHVMSVWEGLSGGVRPGYNNSVYHSEKATADRNFALAHFMKEMGSFPNNTRIHDTLDFYFQCCSIEVTAKSMATIAATFANAGVCPTTENKVFSPETVKNCLSLMYSCGMYDFSGEFAFTVGVPAKSGVSGALLIVIPNVMGIAVWSPRIDEMGNSVRGVDFCRELVRKFNFHNYDSLVGQSKKADPRLNQKVQHINQNYSLIWAACQGDIDEIKRLIAHGIDVNEGDYDKRTAMHLAATEGHFEVVEYLLRKGAKADVTDRFGSTPLADAKINKHKKIVKIIETYQNK